MAHLRMVKPQAYEVTALQAQLGCHPEVWNTFRVRTEHPKSPHRETMDIFVRYNPREKYNGNMQAFNAEHVGEWYPVTETLTEAKRLAEAVAAAQGAKEIGMVLITRIPPGKQVYPHIDGGWHARYYEKIALQIQGNENQAFHFENERLVTHDGDMFWFDNAFPHWVTNDSDEARITMIVCIRR